MTRAEIEREINKTNHIAIYANRVTKQEYKLAGVENLGQAWNLILFVAARNGWNEIDVNIKLVKK